MFANQNVFDLQTLVHKVIRLALFFVWWKKVYIIVYCNCKVENYDDVTGLYGTVLIKFAANLLIILQEWAETEKDWIKGDDKL